MRDVEETLQTVEALDLDAFRAVAYILLSETHTDDQITDIAYRGWSRRESIVEEGREADREAGSTLPSSPLRSELG